jgi:hypothetical protein
MGALLEELEEYEKEVLEILGLAPDDAPVFLKLLALTILERRGAFQALFARMGGLAGREPCVD